ncbi:hydroxyacylglutathione hydrolase [Neisseriaceae bacterium TC5R-5]|nr:hydroxyacylglutathione hydrolase [Neisseriaceae bacterium TC5R-5]
MQAMFTVTPVRAFTDNYIWVLQDGDAAVVVDPGDATPVNHFLHQQQLRLEAILLTHHHADHTGGVAALQQTWPNLPVYGPANISGVTHAVQEGSQITLSFAQALVMEVPGHTLDHVAYYFEKALFCGDTLFGAGCGRVFEGTPQQMLASLKKISQLPASTKIYPAHEYTLANLRFALAVEANNPVLAIRSSRDQALRERDQATLPSTLSLELASNPFLRTAQTSIQQAVAQYSEQPFSDEATTFALLRAWKNQF